MAESADRRVEQIGVLAVFDAGALTAIVVKNGENVFYQVTRMTLEQIERLLKQNEGRDTT